MSSSTLRNAKVALNVAQTIAGASPIPQIQVLFAVANTIVQSVEDTQNVADAVEELAERVCETMKTVSLALGGGNAQNPPELENDLLQICDVMDNIRTFVEAQAGRTPFERWWTRTSDTEKARKFATDMNNVLQSFVVSSNIQLRLGMQDLKDVMASLTEALKPIDKPNDKPPKAMPSGNGARNKDASKPTKNPPGGSWKKKVKDNDQKLVAENLERLPSSDSAKKVRRTRSMEVKVNGIPASELDTSGATTPNPQRPTQSPRNDDGAKKPSNPKPAKKDPVSPKSYTATPAKNTPAKSKPNQFKADNGNDNARRAKLKAEGVDRRRSTPGAATRDPGRTNGGDNRKEGGAKPVGPSRRHRASHSSPQPPVVIVSPDPHEHGNRGNRGPGIDNARRSWHGFAQDDNNVVIVPPPQAWPNANQPTIPVIHPGPQFYVSRQQPFDSSPSNGGAFAVYPDGNDSYQPFPSAPMPIVMGQQGAYYTGGPQGTYPHHQGFPQPFPPSPFIPPIILAADDTHSWPSSDQRMHQANDRTRGDRKQKNNEKDRRKES